MSEFKVRAVQIDLARQIETMDTVKKFLEVSAEAGMNMVVFYLEDRIRTETYPYSPDEESYSVEQMKELVAYGQKLSLDIVPVVSPIGHAERFLRHEEMKHIAELRGRIAGAFTEAGVEHYHTTCPSLPETYEFFDKYITEVASIFPSKYFHIGYDEIWDMGFCELCKHKTMEELYFDSMMHFYDLLKGLGKEVMIWDDMIEQFPWVIEKLPRDIIMCAWFYSFNERFPSARFSTGRKYDVFALFEKLGFRYLASTGKGGSIDSLTAYAQKYNPMGMFQTNWEMSDHQQIPYLYPVISYAGALWSGKADAGIDAVIKAASAYTEDEISAKALATAMTAVSFMSMPLPGEGTSYHLPSGNAYKIMSMHPLVETILDNASGDRIVLDAYRVKLHLMKLRFRMWETGYALHEYRADNGSWEIDRIRKEAQQCSEDADKIYKEAVALWDICRPGLPRPNLERNFAAVKKSALWLVDKAASAAKGYIGRLVVRFDVPEYTSAVKTAIELKYTDGTVENVAYGTFKSPFENQKFDISFEISAEKVPQSVTFKVNGYGGTGFQYVSATLPGKKNYVPSGVSKVCGQVEHSDFILSDDTRSCMLNEQEMIQYFLNDNLHKKMNMITVELKEE